MDPVDALARLDVTLNRTPTGQIRVELVDASCGLRLVSLDPREAASLAGVLVAKSARAGWTAHDPGE